MRRLLHATLWAIGLATVLYVYFLVPVGRRTLWEHTQRIAATEPAQELEQDLDQTRAHYEQEALREWEARAHPTQSPAPP